MKIQSVIWDAISVAVRISVDPVATLFYIGNCGSIDHSRENAKLLSWSQNKANFINIQFRHFLKYNSGIRHKIGIFIR